MNVIIPPKRRDKGSSFNQLVAYISDRGDRPKDEDELSDGPRKGASASKKAAFDRLVDYVDRHDGDERLIIITETFDDGRQRLISSGVACETNCFSWETAAAEMNMVAAQNTRCLDPVYHFILSWRENEAPTDAQIFESAQHCIRQVGMEGHQYVTAIHQDTDNTHCHVAVNRVNSITYKAANLWNDADILQKSCRVLERKYGFIQDNGSWEWGVNDQLVRAPFRFGSAPQGTVPLQVYSNTESLYHYAVDEVREELSTLLGAQELTWEKAHHLLHDSGLGLREQGDGLVIYDYLRPDDSPVVKASSVHPTLTKAQLEPYIGKYSGRPSFATQDFDDDDSYLTMRSTYQPQFELRDKTVRFERQQARADARLDLKLRYKKYRDAWQKPDLNVAGRQRAIADHYRVMKATVRKNHRDPQLRKLMYRAAEFDRMKAMAQLRIELREERQALADKGQARPLPYRAWIEQEALKGDVAAVSQLRGFAYREKRQKRRDSQDLNRVILCAPADDSPMLDWHSHTALLRRDGTIDYMRDGVVGVRDHGDAVVIGEAFDNASEVANFKLALAAVSHKSGETMSIAGEIPFMEQTLHALRDFNQEFGLSRIEPTPDDQRRYLAYLEENEQSPAASAYPVDPESSRSEPKPGWYPRPQ